MRFGGRFPRTSVRITDRTFDPRVGGTFPATLVGRHVELKGFKGDGELPTFFIIDARKQNYGNGKPRKLFWIVVTSVVLYGCKVWGSNMSDNKWIQVERIQKHLITSNLKVKSTVPYKILLAEASLFPMEALAIICFLTYLKEVDGMDEHWWPKLIVAEELKHKKKTWRK